METTEVKPVKEYVRLYIYYILIAVISLLSVVVFPIVGAGSSFDVKSALPNTFEGWLIWSIIRVMIIVLNMLIFTNFLQQAKLNVKDNENFKKAQNLLQKFNSKSYNPKSPKEYLGHMYLTKGVFLAVSTFASLFAIGNAILNYDYMLLIATAFTVILSIVFGIMSMKKVEVYYCYEYLDFAEKLVEDSKKVKRVEINDALKNFKKYFEEKRKCLQLTENNSEILKNK